MCHRATPLLAWCSKRANPAAQLKSYTASGQADAIFDETTVRRELTDAMIVAGGMAYTDWLDRCRTDPGLTVNDLVSDVYVRMRRAFRAGHKRIPLRDWKPKSGKRNGVSGIR